MTTCPKDALHQVHIASNDVLEGYKTTLERAELKTPGSKSDLMAMHTRNSMELTARLSALGYAHEDDTSLGGKLTSVEVTTRQDLQLGSRVDALVAA